MTNSENFAAFIDGLRSSGTEIHGTNAQVASLIACALDIVNPEQQAAHDDAETLAMDMHVISEQYGDDTDYDDDAEED